MEAYRSGHNGPDSKSGNLNGFVGSNPTASAQVKWLKTFYPCGFELFFVGFNELKYVKTIQNSVS